MHISRNKRIGAAAVAVAALPVTALALQPTNAASTSSAQETFRLVERPGTFKYLDLPPKQRSNNSPPSVGDEIILTSRLYRSGTRVGTLHAVCTVTKRTGNVERTPLSCVGSFVLGRDSIEVAGIVVTEDIDIAITGGTGRYAGARGTVTAKSSGRRTVDTIHLLP